MNYKVSIKVGSYIDEIKYKTLGLAKSAYDFTIDTIKNPKKFDTHIVNSPNADIDSVRLMERKNSYSKWKVIKEFKPSKLYGTNCH